MVASFASGGIFAACDDVAQGESDPRMNIGRRCTRLHSSSNSRYDYVIIGTSTSAHAAVEAILMRKPEAEVLIVSEEEKSGSQFADVYHANVTSADLMSSYNEWRRHIITRLHTDSSKNISAMIGENNIIVDACKSKLILQNNSEVHFSKCLIATAGVKRQFYNLDSAKIGNACMADRLNTLNDMSDFEQLESIRDIIGCGHVVVVGGGMLGTEVSSALASRGMRVSQVYAERVPLQRQLPYYLALEVQARLLKIGVRPMPERLVTAFDPVVDDPDDGASSIVEGEDAESGLMRLTVVGMERANLRCDYAVLASTHIDASVDPIDPQASGLEIDPKNGGIMVNAQLEALQNVFVAGSAASFYDTALGRRRVDRFDHAVNSGLAAGHNMTKEFANHDESLNMLYTHQPMFRNYMPAIDVICEAVGEIDSTLFRTVGVWQTTHGGQDEVLTENENSCLNRGIVYYLDDEDKIMGILLWNASDLLERSRETLRRQQKKRNVATSAQAFKRMIPLAPESWLTVHETRPTYVSLK
uniref:FAD/NAD(P)-binding domain-containing protein n=1 Tax=Octactis speculum TaxID=3111310 RepID=A0A7S2GEZ9_9STRA